MKSLLFIITLSFFSFSSNAQLDSMQNIILQNHLEKILGPAKKEMYYPSYQWTFLSPDFGEIQFRYPMEGYEHWFNAGLYQQSYSGRLEPFEPQEALISLWSTIMNEEKLFKVELEESVVYALPRVTSLETTGTLDHFNSMFLSDRPAIRKNEEPLWRKQANELASQLDISFQVIGGESLNYLRVVGKTGEIKKFISLLKEVACLKLIHFKDNLYILL